MDDLHYVPGDFYRLDDRSGFKVRAKKQRKEWTELIVDAKLWEVRHPQDFVKGVVDDQTVPEPRPRPQSDPSVGPPIVTLVNPTSFTPITFDENPFDGRGNYVYGAGSGPY